MNESIKQYIETVKHWKEEIILLRSIVLECELTETLKWKQPCYTFQEKNVVLIGSFKNHCGLLFFKGSHVKDELHILEKPGEHTQEGRIIKLTSIQQIKDLKEGIKNYIQQSIEMEKLGKSTPATKMTDIAYSPELLLTFEENLNFKKAFDALTPGRQRAYHIYFSAAKQSVTRKERIEKYVQQILNGKGINDCTCGLSKRMPTCDGSHKFLSKSQ
jgi:uncharacterized protein YdeI (YjbR/CyaY-like superfamily)